MLAESELKGNSWMAAQLKLSLGTKKYRIQLRWAPQAILKDEILNDMSFKMSLDAEIAAQGSTQTFDPSKFKNPPPEYSPLPFYFINIIPTRDLIADQLAQMKSKHTFQLLIHPRRGIELREPPMRFRLLLKLLGGFWAGPLLDRYFAQLRLSTPNIYLTQDWWKLVELIAQQADRAGMILGIYDELDWPSGTAGMSIPAQIPELRARYLEPSGKLVHDKNWVDTLNPESASEFISRVHAKYLAQLGELWSLVKYFYSDEITMVHHFRASKPRLPAPFNPEISSELRSRYGLDPKLHQLWLDSPGAPRFRYRFWSLITQLYSRFHSQIKNWCDSHGVIYTGHLLMEEPSHIQIAAQGNILEILRQFRIPGVDHLGLGIGGCHPRLAMSAAHQIGSNRVLCECFGASGWELELGDLFWISNWLLSNGINLINPHGFYMSIQGFRKYDYPPSQFIQARYWEQYSRFSDYISRGCYLMSCGQHDPQVAVYYPIGALWGACNLSLINPKFNLILNELEFIHAALSFLQIDYDFLDDQPLLKSRLDPSSNQLVLGQERYSALILPCALYLSWEVWNKLLELIESGFKLIFTSCPPCYCLNGEASPRDFLSSKFGIDPIKLLRKIIKPMIPWAPGLHLLRFLIPRLDSERAIIRISRWFPQRYRLYRFRNCWLIWARFGALPHPRYLDILRRLIQPRYPFRILTDGAEFRTFNRTQINKLRFICNLGNNPIKLEMLDQAQLLDLAGAGISKLDPGSILALPGNTGMGLIT